MLLEIESLHTHLATGNQIVRAVDGISFQMERGETFCLVGESGSGKSMTALSIMQLVPKSIATHQGRIWFDYRKPDGERERVDILAMPESQHRRIRGARISMIFQEPMTSLNPVYTVGDQIVETLLLHMPTMTPREARHRTIELLEQVRIPDAPTRANSYPHQMSGGQRQRVMIAMALACRPDLLIADEPTTALDVTVQAEILRLMDDMQRERDMSILFITHDLAVVSQIADRVAVMRHGKIVEQGDIGDVLRNPSHAYTQELLASVPENLARQRRSGEPAGGANGKVTLATDVEAAGATQADANTRAGANGASATPAPNDRRELPAVNRAEADLFEAMWEHFRSRRGAARLAAALTAILSVALLGLYGTALERGVGPAWLAAPGLMLGSLGLLVAFGQAFGFDWARSVGRFTFSLGLARDGVLLGGCALAAMLPLDVLASFRLPAAAGAWGLGAGVLLAGPLAVNLLLLALTRNLAFAQLAACGNRYEVFARSCYVSNLPRRRTHVAPALMTFAAGFALITHATQLAAAGGGWIVPFTVVGLIFASVGVYLSTQAWLGHDDVRGLGLSVFGFGVPLALVTVVAVPFGVPITGSFPLDLTLGMLLLLAYSGLFTAMFRPVTPRPAMAPAPAAGQGHTVERLVVQVEADRRAGARVMMRRLAVAWFVLGALNASVLFAAATGGAWLGLSVGVPWFTDAAGMALAAYVGGALVLLGSGLLVVHSRAGRGLLTAGIVAFVLGAAVEGSMRVGEANPYDVLFLPMVGLALGLVSLRLLWHARAGGAAFAPAPTEPSAEDPPATKAPAPAAGGTLVTVNALRTYFPIKKGLLKRTVGHVRAVDAVDVSIRRGRIVALVGESGCGKTTLGRSLLRLIEPTGGGIVYDGLDLMAYSRAEIRPFRKEMQFIFQDPQSSLNPRLTIETILTEPMQAHGIGGSRGERIELARETLRRVELDPEVLGRYPHEFSGGQRQRIGIARALVLNPKFIVCDEVTSALDVSVQAKILELLLQLREERDLTLLFITHNIGVVEYLSDETAVMYNGKIVERGPTELVCGDPQHPYTRKLLAAVPRIQWDRQPRRRTAVSAEPAPAGVG